MPWNFLRKLMAFFLLSHQLPFPFLLKVPQSALSPSTPWKLLIELHCNMAASNFVATFLNVVFFVVVTHTFFPLWICIIQLATKSLLYMSKVPISNLHAQTSSTCCVFQGLTGFSICLCYSILSMTCVHDPSCSVHTHIGLYLFYFPHILGYSWLTASTISPSLCLSFQLPYFIHLALVFIF